MISLVLPTYNESENIATYVPILHKLLKDRKIPFEILVVDDNSPDKTWKVAENLAKEKKWKEVRVFNRVGEKGLSSAILFGICNAQNEFVCVLDADMQHDESIIPAMLEAAENQDLVIGSRKVEGGTYGKMPLYRRWMSKIADTAANLIIPIPAKDSMSGFFLVRKSIIEKNLEILNPKGFKILLEILCRIPHLRIQEVGYSFRKRTQGKTKLSSLVVIEYFTSLLEIRFDIKITPVFIKYSLVGILGVFVNLFVQFFASLALGNTQILEYQNQFFKPSLAVVIGFEVSLIGNFILNHFWTFRKTIHSFLAPFFKFHLVSLLGFLVQLSVWAFLYSAWLTYWEWGLGFATYLSNFIGIVVAFITNFYLNKNVTWKD